MLNYSSTQLNNNGIPKCFLTVLTFAASKHNQFFDRIFLPRLQNRDFAHATAFRARAVNNLHLFQKILKLTKYSNEIEASLELSNVLLSLANTNVLEKRQHIVDKWQSGRHIETLVFLPGQSQYVVLEIKYWKIIKQNSSTEPVLIPLLVQDAKTKSTTVMSILIKSESVLKDMVVMDTLFYISLLQKKPALDYHVMNLTPSQGLVLIVPDSRTLQSIMYDSKMTLLNYIIEQNRYDLVEDLQQRFRHSCVLASILSHLCGIGDRHMENLLIHRSGYLFHIDFGFIFGEEPIGKQTSITMKLTPDIVNCIGGENSLAFAEFKDDISNIYNRCRDHIKDFYYIFSPLVMTKMIKKETLLLHILKTFVPGETTTQAKIQIEEYIYHNTNERKIDQLLDLTHTIKSKWFS